MSARTTEELQGLLSGEVYDFRFDCGYSKSTTAMSLEDGKEMVHCIWLYHIMFQCHAALDQFRRGLCETLQFGHLMSTYAEEARGLLAASTTFNVTADYLCDAFVIQYSDNGSNKRTKEEAIIFMWYDYITDCAERNDISLADILKFISGSSKIPASGFGSLPKICFTDTDCLPFVSTCDIAITFPGKMGFLLIDQFKERMDFCIQGSHGFGSV